MQRIQRMIGNARRVDAKNVLDEPFEQRVGSVVRVRDTTGRVLALGLSWQR